jgi:hypothetical protein
MTHSWDDPNLKTLYHVQLETRDLIMSCEVATPDFDAAELAKAHLRSLLPEPDESYIHVGCCSSVGYAPLDTPPIVDFRVTTGNSPFPVDFEGRPVQIIVKQRPTGFFVGTDHVVVSNILNKVK